MENRYRLKRTSKFNPPLKNADNSQDSSSWSLPPSQTHTVLSYCEKTVEEPIQYTTTKHKNSPASHKPLVRSKRSYNYGHLMTRRNARPKIAPKKSKSSIAGVEVFDYLPTPVPGKRTKEQVRK